MEKHEILSQYLDGELGQAEEQKLFYRLATDDEMRREFSNMITIGRSIRSNSHRFAPPAAVTASVFSELGYKAPVGGAAMGAAIPAFFSKYSQAIYSGLASAAATAIVMLMLLWPGDQPAASLASGEAPARPVVESTAPASESDIYISDNISGEIKSETPESKTTITNKTQKTASDSKAAAGFTIDEDLADNDIDYNQIGISGMHGSPLSAENLDYNNDISKIADFNPPAPVAALSLFPEKPRQSSNPVRISMEYRGSQYWSVPEPAVYPAKFAKFNNNAITLFWQVNDNFSVGPELRQENFYQEFTGLDALGKETVYKQQPNFTSFGLSMRYALKDIGVVHPIGQFTLGGNASGALGRVMAGLVYNPTPNVSFIIGGEYSVLLYRHQGGLFDSQKFGLNYGVAYNF